MQRGCCAFSDSFEVDSKLEKYKRHLKVVQHTFKVKIGERDAPLQDNNGDHEDHREQGPDPKSVGTSLARNILG
jgi:hypothetical protein